MAHYLLACPGPRSSVRPRSSHPSTIRRRSAAALLRKNWGSSWGSNEGLPGTEPREGVSAFPSREAETGRDYGHSGELLHPPRARAQGPTGLKAAKSAGKKLAGENGHHGALPRSPAEPPGCALRSFRIGPRERPCRSGLTGNECVAAFRSLRCCGQPSPVPRGACTLSVDSTRRRNAPVGNDRGNLHGTSASMPADGVRRFPNGSKHTDPVLLERLFPNFVSLGPDSGTSGSPDLTCLQPTAAANPGSP